jgi:AcrR family transcriptional regulator
MARVPYQAAAKGLLRESVMSAVDDLVRSRGWAATTMSDVATAAGVSRQTLYNEFGSRAALVEAYVTRELTALIDEVTKAVHAHADDAHRALRSAFELFLKLASDEPIIQIVVADREGGELLRLLTGIGQNLASNQVTALILEVWPQVRPADAQLVAESLVRLAISHAMLPSQPAATVAKDVGRLLAPFVEEALAPRRPLRR